MEPIVVQSGWYRVRWRMDVEGREERVNLSEKIAPVVFDKSGDSQAAIPGNTASGSGNRRAFGCEFGRTV
jgi:hypothetical protein